MEESRFTLFRLDGLHPLSQHCRKCFADACFNEWDGFVDGFVMVWGGIAHRVKSGDCYREQYDSCSKVQGGDPPPNGSPSRAATSADFTAGHI